MQELAALRAYVTAPGHMQAQAESTVRLVVSHSNLKIQFLEIRLDRHVRLRCSASPALCPGWLTAAAGLHR